MRKKREAQNNNPPTGSTPPFCPTTTVATHAYPPLHRKCRAAQQGPSALRLGGCPGFSFLPIRSFPVLSCLLTTLLLPLPLLAPCACLSAWPSRVCGGIVVAVLVRCAPRLWSPLVCFFLLVRTYVGLWLAVMDCLLIGYVVPFFWLFFGGGSWRARHVHYPATAHFALRACRWGACTAAVRGFPSPPSPTRGARPRGSRLPPRLSPSTCASWPRRV